MIAASAPANLRELIEATLSLTCPDGEVPVIEQLCFAARWAVIELSDERAGRAFTFNGQHAVYGALDFEHMRSMKCLLGMRADRAIAQLFREGASAQASLARSVALAIVNALSCELNAPTELE